GVHPCCGRAGAELRSARPRAGPEHGPRSEVPAAGPGRGRPDGAVGACPGQPRRGGRAGRGGARGGTARAAARLSPASVYVDRREHDTARVRAVVGAGAMGAMYAAHFVGWGAEPLLVAVKHHDLARALDDVAPFVGPGTTFVSVLNGLDSEEVIAERFG